MAFKLGKAKDPYAGRESKEPKKFEKAEKKKGK